MPPTQGYISTELTHFVGASLKSAYPNNYEEKQYDLLNSILRENLLKKRDPNLDPAIVAVRPAQPLEDVYLGRFICFCDIPVKDLNIHVQKYSRFGLSFQKKWLAEKGATPVFYVSAHSPFSKDPADTRPNVNRRGHFEERWHDYYLLTQQLITRVRPLQKTTPDLFREVFFDVEKRVTELREFLDCHVFNYMKYFDAKKEDDDPNNYYMEREWRYLFDLRFTIDDVCRVLLPKQYEERFKRDWPQFKGQITSF